MIRKGELVEAVCDAADISTAEATEAVNAIFDQITNALARDEKITLVGFGTFEKRHRGARQGKNPKTGETIEIAASNTVGFKPGKTFKEEVNR